MFERRLYFHIDWLLLGAVLTLAGIGVAMIYSTTYRLLGSLTRDGFVDYEPEGLKESLGSALGSDERRVKADLEPGEYGLRLGASEARPDPASHTGWDQHWRTDTYSNGEHPFLTEGAATALAKGGAAIVGIDSYNIDSTTDGKRPAQEVLGDVHRSEADGRTVPNPERGGLELVRRAASSHEGERGAELILPLGYSIVPLTFNGLLGALRIDLPPGLAGFPAS